MKQQPFSFFDYVKKAFMWRFRIPLLGTMPLNILGATGFGILGFGNPAFWVLGMGLEAGYLLFLAGNERFQKVVQGQSLLKQQEELAQQQKSIISKLSLALQKRYENLVRFGNKIVGNIGSNKNGAENLQFEGLGQLLWTFLQLLVSKNRIESILQEITKNDLQKEIDIVKKKLENTPAGTTLARSLQGSFDIAQKRLENINKAEDNLNVVDAELERIEKQFALLREESSISSDPEVLSSKLDGVIQSLQNTSQWLSDHREWFNSLNEPVINPVQITETGLTE